MATLAVTPLIKDVASASLPIAGGTAFTDASVFEVAYPIEGKLLLIINSTLAGASTATIGAGTYISSGIGSLVIVTAQNGVYYVVVSSDRFKIGSGVDMGMIKVTFGATNTGFIRALSVP